MSSTTALGIAHNVRPVTLAEYRNAWGWAPSIWDRLIKHNDLGRGWIDSSALDQLWRVIEELPYWQQIPNLLTFDTGVIPWQEYGEAAVSLREFERRLPAPAGHANHVPAVADLLASISDVPFFGMWGTSVTENPFDPWDGEADAPGSGLPIEAGSVYLLERHRRWLPEQIASR